MLALWIILGLLGYVLSCILVVVLNVVRMTFDKKEYEDTFKKNLLSILDGHISTDEQFGLVLSLAFSPIGICAQIVMIIADFVDRTFIEKLREWCRK